jgi:ubiquinone/menaquinone biosynthesis C-methylase UbiE
MADDSASETKTNLEIMAHFDEESLRFDFERTAAGYRLRHQLVKNLFLKRYRLGAIVLDLGCGTGEYTLSMAQAGFNVVGGDLSRNMLAAAKSKISGSGLAKKIHLIRLESTKLPFLSQAFDAITCIAVLDWWPNPHRALSDANRVLKNQARLIICVDSLWSPYRIYRKAQRLTSHSTRKQSRIVNSTELEHLLTACGFAVERFFGDILLGQIIMRMMYEPRRIVLAKRVLKVTQPIDRYLTDLPFLKSLSAHYIIEARKA